MAWFLIDGMYVSDLSYLAVFTVLDCLQSRLRSGIWKGDSPYNGLSTAEEVTKGISARGLTAIVTGGTSGIGKETVRVLGLRGARVVIGAINMEEGNRTKDELLKLHPDLALDVLELDLTSMASIYEFAANFNALNAPLNILINNAGIMHVGLPFRLSEDGIELHFAINYLGHFLLTNLLLGNMKATAKKSGIQGRIVNVSSYGHNFGYEEGIRFDKINEESDFTPFKAYAQSKLAILLHTIELARRLQDEEAKVTVNALHPGVVATSISNHNKTLAFLTSLEKPLMKNIPQGATTTCYLALHSNLKEVNGKYFSDCKETSPNSIVGNSTLIKKLWDFSERMILKYRNSDKIHPFKH